MGSSIDVDFNIFFLTWGQKNNIDECFCEKLAHLEKNKFQKFQKGELVHQGIAGTPVAGRGGAGEGLKNGKRGGGGRKIKCGERGKSGENAGIGKIWESVGR